MSTRKGQAKWDDKAKRWRISVQKDGVRRAFYSSNPSTRGKFEAERKADHWLDTGSQNENIRLGAAWDEFLNYTLDKGKGGTRQKGTANHKKHEQMGRLYILPVLTKNKKVMSITEAQWQKCIDIKYKDGLSKKSLQNIRGSITSFCKYMRRNGVKIDTPEIEIPDDAPVKERKILQPDALKMLFSEDSIKAYGKDRQCHYIHAWRFQVLSGFRPGEICGLQKSDIKDDVVTVNRSVNIDGEITSGKNTRANRSVYLSKLQRQILDEQAKMLQSKGIVTKWIFAAPDGGPGNEKSMYKTWLKFCEQRGFRCSLYELRHTLVSYAQDKVPENLLKSIVGHSKSMDTFGVYGHQVDGDLQRAAGYIDDLFKDLVK